MRIAVLTLALFCALISGWTAALAQIQDLGGNSMHHAGAATSHAMPADKAAPACAAPKSCDQPKMVHPLSCAACFAVVLEIRGLDRIELPGGTVRPARQKPLLATLLKPRFPPPKTSPSFS